MNRKQFILSHGATCDNWTWSWSFVNVKERIVIFGAWDHHTEGDTTLIFSQAWEYNEQARKQAAYDQSREHIRLIEEEGFELKTFPIVYFDASDGEDLHGPSKIDEFVPKLTTKLLKRIGDSWYASSNGNIGYLPEEVPNPEKYTEGSSKQISVNYIGT